MQFNEYLCKGFNDSYIPDVFKHFNFMQTYGWVWKKKETKAFDISLKTQSLDIEYEILPGCTLWSLFQMMPFISTYILLTVY